MSEDYQEKPKRSEEGRKPKELLENRTNRLVGAIVLIGLGVFFLLSESNILDLSGNWWAFFIALPAVVMLYNGYMAYQQDGRITKEVRDNVSGGAMVGTVAIIAFTGQWGTLWPFFLIVPGVLWLVLGSAQEDEMDEADQEDEPLI
ncbi:hypothetical protein ACFLYO_00315 [Chloroflexota bacterium]